MTKNMETDLLNSGVSLLDVVTLDQFDVIAEAILLGQKWSCKNA